MSVLYKFGCEIRVQIRYGIQADEYYIEKHQDAQRNRMSMIEKPPVYLKDEFAGNVFGCFNYGTFTAVSQYTFDSSE